ncbi:DUF6301 family protein [Nocardia terpenica]|uniref:Uncharacterized protein n=1 Tax=Nocardia terpenica TaxID=455432 RepID=A0A0U1Z263_9NOCA|nr:DUF6301 family protein [Nocardia terpenica]AJO72788.1 hypothetical protein [Nocardia terpenica]KZM75407.1 hypothetical protein AWN90_18655 [Nocardia terpenica]NQE85870.1 hypothetical protein [Nocardia terpenica]BBE00891.1 hypothetical protein [Nocardia terpenica]
MTEGRLADSEIVDLATRLRSFNWSWRLADVSVLVDAFGWQVQTTRPDWGLLDDGFGMASGRVHGRDGAVEGIELRVTDYATDDPHGREQVRDAFAGMAVALSASFGEPSARKPGESAEIRWAGPDTTVQLTRLGNSVRLRLAANDYLRALDRAVELEAEGLL